MDDIAVMIASLGLSEEALRSVTVVSSEALIDGSVADEVTVALSEDDAPSKAPAASGQETWGLHDPEQCGLPALFAALERPAR